jgi:carboxypeptidase C (cathepsin A)
LTRSCGRSAGFGKQPIAAYLELTMSFGFRLMHAVVPLALLAAGLSTPARAADAPAAAEAAARPHMPADSVVHHSMDLPGRTLAFSTTAGAIRTNDLSGKPLADIAFVAYTLDGAAPATRPVTFVFNGGPGMASGWLQVGSVGPWIIPMGGDAIRPSAPPALAPNGDTWLDFTDLVFIDPAGTGFSRAIATGEDSHRQLYSVDGDIDYLAQVVRRWLDKSGRIVSPKYLLGESYGGFRAPRLARALEHDQGVGISGVMVISPALDFGGRSAALDPLAWATRLPSMTAAARAAKGLVTQADLADVEQYAAGDYVTDLLRGEHDAAAVARMSARVAAFTGLDPALVARYHGRIDMDVFLHEIGRAKGRVASPYNATVSSPDPFPLDPSSDYEEPIVQALIAPITSAMVSLYSEQLHWQPDDNSLYRLSNESVFRAWDWGRHMYGGAESVSALRTAMALDSHLRVLIGQGMFDLLTPYFGTELILRQVPDLGAPDRIRLVVYPGGHMFYTQEASRAAYRDEARKLVVGE